MGNNCNCMRRLSNNKSELDLTKHNFNNEDIIHVNNINIDNNISCIKKN